MIVGVHENRSLSEVRSAYPRAKLVRRFISGVLKPQSLVDKVRRLGEDVWSDGGVLVVSFKPDVKSVLDGKWDDDLTELALWLRENIGKATYVVPWHEPENDLTATVFVNMFNHVYDVLKGAHPKLTIIHSAMAYQYRVGGRAENVKAWVTKADLNTCDVYSGKSFPLGTILPEHAGFKRWHAVFGELTWGITERGWHATPGDKADARLRASTIRREAKWLVTQPSCVMYIYWNTSGTEDNDELVASDTETQEAILYLTELLGGGLVVDPGPSTEMIQCPTCKGKGRIEVVR